MYTSHVGSIFLAVLHVISWTACFTLIVPYMYMCNMDVPQLLNAWDMNHTCTCARLKCTCTIKMHSVKERFVGKDGD